MPDRFPPVRHRPHTLGRSCLARRAGYDCTRRATRVGDVAAQRQTESVRTIETPAGWRCFCCLGLRARHHGQPARAARVLAALLWPPGQSSESTPRSWWPGRRPNATGSGRSPAAMPTAGPQVRCRRARQDEHAARSKYRPPADHLRRRGPRSSAHLSCRLRLGHVSEVASQMVTARRTTPRR